MYETYYDKIQPYFSRENLQLPYMDTVSFILSVNTKDNIKDSKYREDLFDFNNLNESQEISSNKKKKVIGKFKIESPKNISIDKFVCLRSKMYSFDCGDDKKKLKGIFKSQTTHINFGEYKKCLDGENYRKECIICILRSLNQEMYLQELKKFDIIYFR